MGVGEDGKVGVYGEEVTADISGVEYLMVVEI